jgi:hypothetical protein
MVEVTVRESRDSEPIDLSFREIEALTRMGRRLASQNSWWGEDEGEGIKRETSAIKCARADASNRRMSVFVMLNSFRSPRAGRMWTRSHPSYNSRDFGRKCVLVSMKCSANAAGVAFPAATSGRVPLASFERVSIRNRSASRSLAKFRERDLPAASRYRARAVADLDLTTPLGLPLEDARRARRYPLVDHQLLLQPAVSSACPRTAVRRRSEKLNLVVDQRRRQDSNL